MKHLLLFLLVWIPAFAFAQTPVITASGPITFCNGGSVTLNSSITSDITWSTGETTPSITVTASGDYYVINNGTIPASQSAIFTVTVHSINSFPSSTPSIPACNGDPVTLSPGASSTQAYSSLVFNTSVPVFIPDADLTGITSPIVVSGINPSTLNTNSVVSVTMNLTHTWDSDLEISLVAPSGNSILLSNRNGGADDNFTNTVFTMDASTFLINGVAPFTGSFRPDENFTALTGNSNGTWRLKVRDLASQDTGRVVNWSIRINNAVPDSYTYQWASIASIPVTSTLQNPTFNPTATTVYRSTVTSSVSGCTGTGIVVVVVTDTLKLNSFLPTSSIPGEIVTLKGKGFNAVTTAFVGTTQVGFQLLNDSIIKLMIPGIAAGSYPICLKNFSNCTSCSVTNFTITNYSSLFVQVLLQGLYAGGGTLKNVSEPRYGGVCDTILLSLRNSTSPFATVYFQKSILFTSGGASLFFPAALTGSFFLTVNHRNSLEIWSANPVSTSSGLYTFSNAASKARGSNMVDLGSGSYGMYAGDLTGPSGTQDGTVDMYDIQKMQTDCSVFSNGFYLPADLNADAIIETEDYSLMESNYGKTVNRP